MIRHVILISIERSVSEGYIAGLIEDLIAIKEKLPSWVSVTSGRSASPKKN